MQIVKFPKISFDDGCFISASLTSVYSKVPLHIKKIAPYIVLNDLMIKCVEIFKAPCSYRYYCFWCSVCSWDFRHSHG